MGGTLARHLIIGHSHTACIQQALTISPDARFSVLNLRVVDGDFRDQLSVEPDCVFLLIRGNQHNVLTLCESPKKFGVGGLELPDNDERIIIPYVLFRDAIFRRMSSMEADVRSILKNLPSSKFFIVCPPPPKQDVGEIRRLNEFRDMRKLGFSPPALREAAYRIQADHHEKFAREMGMGFIPPPDCAKTKQGLLAFEYSNDDPTHGNEKYGALLLRQFADIVEPVA